MKRKAKKILIIIFCVFLALFITAFILAKTGVFVKQFKNIIQAELSKALNREVTIESIEGGVFDSITLNNVRIASNKEIKDGMLIVIEKVTINYSFKDIIFNKKEIIDSLKSIHIKKPSIFVEDDKDGSWNIQKFLESINTDKQMASNLKTKIYIVKGLVGFKDNKKKFNSSIRDIFGDISFDDNNNLLVNLKAKGFKSKKFNLFVAANVNLTDKKYSITLKGNSFQLPHYAAYGLLFLKDKSNLNILDGAVDFSLLIDENVAGNFEIKKGVASIEGLKDNITDISSNLKLEKSH